MAATSGDEKLPTSPDFTGYRRLADYMAWNPSTAIFERFRSANILNLLGLQAEIARIQDELMRTTISEKPLGNQYQNDWTALEYGDGGDRAQRKLIMRLRERLKEYNTALVHQITIGNQPNPNSRDLRLLCQFIEDPYGLCSNLRGPGQRIWFSKANGKPKVADKFVLWQGSEGRDSLTQFISKGLSRVSFILPYFHVEKRSFPPSPEEIINPEPEKGFEIFTTTGAIIRAGDKIVTVVSCLLITVPIVILNYVTTTALRLVLIIVFTLIFSLALAFMSDAKRKEIFAATAAFVAVQVVFVGSGGSVSG
ncbi:hypothetical protein F5Y12DRAFT_6913 [Xylaria sp. FL1777]|nr:hypothetical protein F5Y12DRAFT_6913 [Xylaria sp. FL1777]